MRKTWGHNLNNFNEICRPTEVSVKESNKISISRGKDNNWCHLRCKSLDIFDTLSWETLDNRRKKSKAVLMYKVLNNHAVPGLEKESSYERNVAPKYLQSQE